MRGRKEALERLATRRRRKLGAMSEQAFEELSLAVAKQPEAFVEDDADRAFLRLVDALEAYDARAAEDEFLDDDAYEASYSARRERLDAACQEVLAQDPNCLDARVVHAQLSGSEAGDVLEHLLTIEGEQPTLGHEGTDAWDDVFARPRLRLRAAIARGYLDTTRFRPAFRACARLVEASPSDLVGARFTWALACARLEDEEAFNALDAKFARQGNAWSHIARILLMFKLDRMSAARRALRGFSGLCEGGAYALLRPAFVDTYLPDRPSFRPGSYKEAVLAVHEADPIVVDTPDFVAWATAQPGVAEDAQRFAEDHDLDW